MRHTPPIAAMLTILRPCAASVRPIWSQSSRPLVRSVHHQTHHKRSPQWYKWLSAGVAVSAVVVSARLCLADAPAEPKALIVELRPNRTAKSADTHTSGTAEPSRIVSCTEFYTANNPREDRSFESIAWYHDEPIQVFGMLDGHGGHQCAEYARNHLPKNIFEALRVCREEPDADANKENTTTPKYISRELERGLVSGFERTDRQFLAAISEAFHAGFSRLARVGACALTCLIYDNYLYVANAGDCMAVMGRVTIKGLEAMPLSNEHNARVKKEADRLAMEHPKEWNIVKCKPDNEHACYVKGRLQPTRSLGDAELKYQEFNATPIKAPYTPPYITATPELTSKKLTRRDRFMILATDGLWDHLSPDDAVRVVYEELNCESNQGLDKENVLRNACRALIDHALSKAADSSNMSVMDLKQLNLGRERRRRHDDITVTLVLLK